jgi:hypothetical protein
VTKTANYFKIKESAYETWMASETEKGTTITVVLEGIKNGVEFDSLVFNGNQLPVTTTNNEGSCVLTAQLTAPTAKLHTEIKKINKPNELVYRVYDKRFYCPLNDIKPKKMRYLKH